MATKQKKNQRKIAVQPQPAAPVKQKIVSKKEPWITGSDIIPLTLVFLYLFVDFVPNFGSADVMGAQWVYLVGLNILSAAFIFFNAKRSNEAIAGVARNLLTILFTSLFVLAGLSILAAMNKIESYVTYARYAAFFVSFLSMAILLYNRMHLFKIVAQILSVFMLIQSINILDQFFTGLRANETLGTIIYNLKGNSGNKNIMAASLVIKIPFAAYCIYTFKTVGKIVNLVIVALGALAVFFINARASYIALILITVTFIAYCLYEYFRHKDLKTIGIRLGLFFLPLVFAFTLSTIIINNQLQFETDETSYGYGSVVNRLSSISFSEAGSNQRVLQWKSAVDYIAKNPLMGAGFGNWKLVSIPYERTFSNEMYITYHVHNDFLEMTAELGLLGGLLYLGLYLCMAFLTFKVVFSNADVRHKQVSVFSLMALAVYFVDAVFNFPIERPIMQVFMASIMAFNLNAYLASRNAAADKPATRSWLRPAYVGLVLLLMVPSMYITYQTYRSMIAQNKYNQDMLSATPVYHSQEVNPQFPKIPNLNVFGFPIDAIKGRYLLHDKKYDEAKALLLSSRHVNPYISYNEFMLGNIYRETGKIDSADYWAEKCFYMKPRAKSNYLLHLAILADKKDSVRTIKAFKEARKFRNEPWIWSDYINALYLCGKDFKYLFHLADSAYKYFPEDPAVQQKYKELKQVQDMPRQ